MARIRSKLPKTAGQFLFADRLPRMVSREEKPGVSTQ